MRTSVPGSRSGFTLLELLVVVAIIAIATAGVSFALREPDANQLDREAQRLAALLEAARAQSRGSGRIVVWRAVNGGFRFEGLADDALPDRWLAPTTRADASAPLVLGPEPIIGRQSVLLSTTTQSARRLRVATDGVRPFAVEAAQDQP